MNVLLRATLAVAFLALTLPARATYNATVTGTVSLAFLPEGGTPLRITKTGYDDLTIGVEIAPAKVEPITLVLVKRRPNPSD